MLESVRLEFEKADGTFHRSFDEIVFARESQGWWSAAAPGGWVRWANQDPEVGVKFSVRFTPDSAWYTIVWMNSPGEDVQVYADLCSPLKFVTRSQVASTDYDLDVCGPLGREELVDEEEFEINAVRFGYSSTVKDTVRAAVADALTTIRQKSDDALDYLSAWGAYTYVKESGAWAVLETKLGWIDSSLSPETSLEAAGIDSLRIHWLATKFGGSPDSQSFRKIYESPNLAWLIAAMDEGAGESIQ